jgi:PAS domain S-box-containing protein
MLATPRQISVCLTLTRAIAYARSAAEIHDAALEALADGLGVARSSILLVDPDGVMRFKAWRGLSDRYRAAVEGHTPWRSDSPDPQPIVVPDVAADESLHSYLPTIRGEGIAGMAFIPLVSLGRVIGKFMLYFDAPRALAEDELQLAGVIAAQVAFAVERTRTEDKARQSEERLRFALDAAQMGTWDWDLSANTVRWSESLERVHGLPPGAFEGTLAAYEREIHPEDRGRVWASARRAIEAGLPHEVEYRIVPPDGPLRWVEGKGRVEYENGRAVRMSGVCMDVTRRKEAELARLGAAEEASRLKDEFLATLSHELRTPLNAIVGWVQMLQSGDLPPERRRHAIDVIARNAQLQAQLIDDILDMSRIITGQLPLEREPVLIGRLIDGAVSAFAPAAAQKRLRVTQTIQAGLPPTEGDAKRLQQVLGNVLGNAVKFTPEGGSIDVFCERDGDAVMVEVRDTGVGIPADFLPFVFERFRQGDSRTTRSHGGLGLGLAIARHLLERHGGTIQADSAGPGQGTTIRIRLPMGAGVPALQALRTAIPPVPLPAHRLDDVTVLVVDDEADSRELLAQIFARCGARVRECASAPEALDALSAANIRLLVADIAMPVMDGFSLVEQVRQTQPRIAAVAVTAYARPEDRDKALAAGFDAWCAKPVNAAELMDTVSRILHA